MRILIIFADKMTFFYYKFKLAIDTHIQFKKLN